jgi:hypothetical protein
VSDKTDRKELRRPDEFQLVAGQAMEWIVARRQLAGGIAGGLLVLALALWGLSAWADSQAAQSGAALGQALALQGRPIAPEGQAPTGDQYANKEDRTKAVQVALERVRADYGSSDAARTAGAELGFLRARNGDTAGAIALFNEYLAKGRTPDALRAAVLEALAVAQEDEGKLDEARSTYALLAEAGAPARAAYHQARLLLLQGKPEAKAELEKVAKEFPKEDVAILAQRRIELASLPPAPAVSPAPRDGDPASGEPAKAGRKPSAPAKPPAKKKG